MDAYKFSTCHLRIIEGLNPYFVTEFLLHRFRAKCQYGAAKAAKEEEEEEEERKTKAHGIMHRALLD